MDRLTKAARSQLMSRVKGHGTQPEKQVQRIVRQLGFRFRCNVKQLPGQPDIVLPSRRKIIFVHGCFWHRHSCSAGQNAPKTNASYWQAKRDRNRRRDRRVVRLLRAEKWSVATVWECQLRKPDRVRRRLLRFIRAVGPA